MDPHQTRSRIQPHPIIAERVRSIGTQGFSFMPNRFLQGGFFAALNADELLLYFLLVLVGDRRGISFYGHDSLCSLLKMPLERYVNARHGLIEKDLIAFDGARFQVLELPAVPPPAAPPLRTPEDFERDDPATIRELIRDSVRGER